MSINIYFIQVKIELILYNVKIICYSTRSLPPVIGFGSTQQQQQLQHQPIPQVPTYGRSVHHDHLQTYGSNDHNDLNRQNGFEKSQYHELNSSRNIGK